jgi:hypothetical protein
MEAAPTRTPLRRSLLARLALLALAVALGLALQHWLTGRLAAIDARSRTDLLGARAELASLLEIASVSVFGMTGAVGVMVILASRRSLQVGVFPAPGVWSWGSRTVTGPLARKGAIAAIFLGVTLIAASAAGGGLTWYMAKVVRSCRAGAILPAHPDPASGAPRTARSAPGD